MVWVQMFGDLPIWTHADRPSVTGFFEQWSARTAVLNGISVESLAHETCVKVMLTGQIDDAPDLGSRVADALGSWRWAFVVLVPGPVVGIVAMWLLRREQHASLMAGGLR